MNPTPCCTPWNAGTIGSAVHDLDSVISPNVGCRLWVQVARSLEHMSCECERKFICSAFNGMAGSISFGSDRFGSLGKYHAHMVNYIWVSASYDTCYDSQKELSISGVSMLAGSFVITFVRCCRFGTVWRRIRFTSVTGKPASSGFQRLVL